MKPWSDERVWDAVDEWRWFPPSATKVMASEYQLAVSPGSPSYTYVYGFKVEDPEGADGKLEEVRRKVVELGGTGAKFQITPRCRPEDLPDRLVRLGYTMKEETEILAWELLDADGRVRLPSFRTPDGISVKRVESEEELARYIDLGEPIFGDPPTSGETRRAFFEEFRTKREKGDDRERRYLAWADGRPVGTSGLEVAGPVARLWGGGVVPGCRGRGVYGAMIAVRLRTAADLGAEVAIVSAIVGTSGPIFKRHGFRVIGPMTVFESKW